MVFADGTRPTGKPYLSNDGVQAVPCSLDAATGVNSTPIM